MGLHNECDVIIVLPAVTSDGGEERAAREMSGRESGRKLKGEIVKSK